MPLQSMAVSLTILHSEWPKLKIVLTLLHLEGQTLWSFGCSECKRVNFFQHFIRLILNTVQSPVECNVLFPYKMLRFVV